MEALPALNGAPAYIILTDAKGNGITYFEGVVEPGQFFTLNDGGQRFEADQMFMIYDASQTTLYQQVQYHSSCSSNLELKNIFGANILVGFFNDVQGNVTCFATVDLDIDIEVPVTVSGDPVMLTSMLAMTNFAGLIDLTDQVAGMTVQPGGSVPVTLDRRRLMHPKN